MSRHSGACGGDRGASSYPALQSFAPEPLPAASRSGGLSKLTS